MRSFTIQLPDEAVAVLKEAEANGVSFSQIMNGLINMASSNSGPVRTDNTDVEIAIGLANARAELGKKHCAKT